MDENPNDWLEQGQFQSPSHFLINVVWFLGVVNSAKVDKLTQHHLSLFLGEQVLCFYWRLYKPFEFHHIEIAFQQLLSSFYDYGCKVMNLAG